MAQEFGFFESRWDKTIVNPETGTLGDWDLKYYYSQFANYFAKFFGNGVYYNPDNNLKVLSDGGMVVRVKAGWAFINGFWFNLKDDLTFTVPANSTAYTRVDSIILRWNLPDRTIGVQYATDNVTPQRSDTIYDLKLAEITVNPSVAEILGDVIEDTRADQEVCGIVRGLESDAIDTETLFAQYDAIFNEWFDTVKDQITGDLGTRLQTEFLALDSKVDTYQAHTEELIAGYNTAAQQAISQANAIVSNFVDKDYVIAEQEFVFTNKVCEINDAKVTSGSLIDVYFTSATIDNAEAALIHVDSAQGKIILTAEQTPLGTISGSIRVRVRS